MDDYLIFNNFQVVTHKPSIEFAAILAAIPDLKYWSYEALTILVVDLSETISALEDDDATKKQKTQFRSFRRMVSRFLEYMPKDRAFLLKRIYDLVLSCDGLSPLHGFGFSNGFGDHLTGNPEYQSVYAT